MPVVSISPFEIDAPLIHSTSAPIAYSTDAFVPCFLCNKKKSAHPTQAPSTIDGPIMLWRSLLAAADFNICATFFRSMNDENSQSALERLLMNLQEKLSSFWVGLHCLSHQINAHKIGTPLLVPYQSQPSYKPYDLYQQPVPIDNKTMIPFCVRIPEHRLSEVSTSHSAGFHQFAYVSTATKTCNPAFIPREPPVLPFPPRPGGVHPLPNSILQPPLFRSLS
jgi:hypothetical protein